jgi:hypothetical protein
VHAGVVHHAVVSAVHGDVGFERRAARQPVADIELHEPALAARSANRSGRALGAGGVAAVVRDDGEALLGRGERDRSAETFACPRDQYCASHSVPAPRRSKANSSAAG